MKKMNAFRSRKSEVPYPWAEIRDSQAVRKAKCQNVKQAWVFFRRMPPRFPAERHGCFIFIVSLSERSADVVPRLQAGFHDFKFN